MRKRKPVLLNGEALMADGKTLEFDAVDQRELDGKIDAPQTAQVGEVLTVEEVDEDGKPIKWKTQTVDVDGVLKYTEQELTIEEQAQARKNIGAQQTDFIVNITHFDEDSNIIIVTLDKTFDEIDTAYKSGRNVKLDAGDYKYYLFDVEYYTDSDGDAITYTFINVNEYGSMEYISVNSRGNNRCEQKRIYKDSWSQLFISSNGWIAGCQLGLEATVANATYVTVPKASGLKAGKVLTTTGKNGVLAMEWRDINFPVTITLTITDDVTTYSADKTFNEIKAAYDSGANVYAELNGVILCMCVAQDNYFIFSTLTSANEAASILFTPDEIKLRVVNYSGFGDSNLTYLIVGDSSNFKFLKNAKVTKYGQYTGTPTTKTDFIESVFNTGINAVIIYDNIKYYCQYMERGATKFCAFDDNNNIKTITVFKNGDEREIIFDDMLTLLPSPTTAQVGQIVKIKSVDESGKITETETVDMPSAEKWEIIKTVEIADGAEETNALTINTDNGGNAFSLKKAQLIQNFPKYTGETTPPNWSFTMVNGITVGSNAPLVYTSGLATPNKSSNAIGVYEIDLTMPGYQVEQTWKWDGSGARKNFVPYYGSRTLNNAETITSIGGTAMLIYPGCKFILYGVRA